MTALILGAEPQLYVSDIAESCAFFASLGFEVAFAWGEPPFYAQVVRDGGRLNLRHVDRPVFAAGFREAEPDALAATFTVDDAAALYAEFEADDVAFHQQLQTEPWGARTFVVADPDGNLILFAG